MTAFSDENSPATITLGSHTRKDTKKSVPNLSLDADFVIFFTR